MSQKTSHKFKPSIITANHLLNGDAVYLTEQRSWSSHFQDAQVLKDTDQADLALAFAQNAADQVVGAYLVSVLLDGNTHKPDHFREAFRAKGPSNYVHGKQEAKHVSV